MASIAKDGKPEVLGPEPTNAAEGLIETQLPYIVEFTIEGVTTLLFHRWSNEAVIAKAKAAKNSKAKKSDDVESYVYRNQEGEICVPGEWVRSSVVNAAKFRQDPRSPRKSAMDLYKAAAVPLTELASLGTVHWDYLDERRVTVQRNAVIRQRPGFNPGWRARFEFQVSLPEYVDAQQFLEVLTLAGRVIGVGDFRPTYGRFQIVHFETLV